MNIAIGMTAAREGAAIANHVEVIALIKEKVRAYVLRDQDIGEPLYSGQP